MQRGGDPLILCFVDFTDPACAATALSALQGDHFSHSFHLSCELAYWHFFFFSSLVICFCVSVSVHKHLHSMR